MKTHQTTARQLLDIVFEGHVIRTVFDNGKWRFYRNDIAKALQIIHLQKSIAKHLDSDELGLTKVSGRSTNGTIQTREVTTLTESGIIALVCASKKPAARRFRRWITDEVMPQLIKYGTYLPGATPTERLQALHRRWREERAACVEASEKTLAESGLMTLKAFRAVHDLPQRDSLPIARRLTKLAKAEGIRPVKLTLRGHGNPANAWPQGLLREAVASTIPRLPFMDALDNKEEKP